ncbi:MAG: hypothetical protein ABR607_15135 [Pyrinomonadaceae bacterium]
MNPHDWIGLGIIALAILGGSLLLNQITKPYDVKDEEEFQRRRKQGGRGTGLMGLQQILDPAAKKAVEVQQDLRRRIYDDEEEPDDPPEAGGRSSPRAMTDRDWSANVLACTIFRKGTETVALQLQQAGRDCSRYNRIMENLRCLNIFLLPVG